MAQEQETQPTQDVATVVQSSGPIRRRKVLPPATGPAAIEGTTQAPRKKRSLVRTILPLALLGGLAYGGTMAYDWFVEGRFIISTDDAYVGATTAVISAKIQGHIAEVAVVNNQAVKAGDLLVRIDDGDYRLAVEAARDKIASQDATIARIGRQIEAQRATIDQSEAQLAAAKATAVGAAADEQRAALEFDRSQKMLQTTFGSQQRLEQAAADKSRTAATTANAVASVASAGAAVAGAKANLDVLAAQKLEAERLRSELVTAKDKAERDLSFAEIRAPFDGIVGNKAVEVGQFAQTGVRLLAVVSLGGAYVDANYKETQLGSIHPGQKVDVTADSYPGKIITGTVQSIAPATGAQFSLLPPDNATGNFTKVVQRVAVRIVLPQDVLAQGILRPGLSVIAGVHTRDESLPKPTLLGALGLTAQAGDTGVKP